MSNIWTSLIFAHFKAFRSVSVISRSSRSWVASGVDKEKGPNPESALFLGVFIGSLDWPPSLPRVLDPLRYGPLPETSIDFQVDRLAPLGRPTAIENVFADIDIAVEDLPCRDFGSAQTKPRAGRRWFARSELRLRGLVSFTELFHAPATDAEDISGLPNSMEIHVRWTRIDWRISFS